MAEARRLAAELLERFEWDPDKHPTGEGHRFIPTGGDPGSKGSDGGPDKANAEKAGVSAREMYRAVRERGGITIGRVSHEVPSHGYVVSVHPEHSLVVGLHELENDRGSVDKWLAEKSHILDQPGNFVGAWHDTASDKVYLDVVEVYPADQRKEAVQAGRDANQIAIWDIGNSKEINTGGTGEHKAKAARIRSILNLSEAPHGGRATDDRRAEAEAVPGQGEGRPPPDRRHPDRRQEGQGSQAAQASAVKLAEIRALVERLYSDDQPRNPDGRWGSGGGGTAAEKVGAGKGDVAAPAGHVLPLGTRPVVGDSRGPTDPRWTVRAGDGKTVNMRLGPGSGGLRPDPQVIAKVLNGVADAYERDPRPAGPPDVVLHSVEGYAERLRGRGMSDEDAQRTAANTRAAVESSRPGEINVVVGTATAGYQHNYMPAEAALAARGDLLAGTMAHEYGHVRFFETLTKGVVLKETTLFAQPAVKQALSSYGRSNHLEAYAEAYAEWHLTAGQTTNGAAQAYGRAMGWKTEHKAKAAARTEKLAEITELIERFYSDEQPRNPDGRWGSGGGGSLPVPRGLPAHGPAEERRRLAPKDPKAVKITPPGNRPVTEVTRGQYDNKFQVWTVPTSDGQEVRATVSPVDRTYARAKGIPLPSVTPEVMAQLLNGAADAYERDPRPAGPPIVRIYSPIGFASELMNQGEDPTSAAQTALNCRAAVFTHSRGVINVVDKVVAQPSNGINMPAAEKLAEQGGIVHVTMAHEYGHIRHLDRIAGYQNDASATKLLEKGKALFANPEVNAHLSKYGRSNHMEAFAECYSEWELTKGTTDNPAAQAYAKAFGWTKSGRSTKLAEIRRLVTVTGIVPFEFDPEKHPRDEKGKWAPIGTPTGIESIPKATLPKVDKRLETLYGPGMTHDKVIAAWKDNLLELAEMGDHSKGTWYNEYHDQLAKTAEANGLKGPNGVGAMAAIVAATSAQTSWEQNIKVATSIAGHMGANTELTLPPGDEAEYNRWAAARGGGAARGPDGEKLIRAHDELSAEHLVSMGGKRNADGSVTIGFRALAEKYSDYAGSRLYLLPGARVMNTDNMVKAIEAFKAGEKDDHARIDALIGGPKERSFVNNLANPNDPTSVTIDRWHWKALSGDMPISWGKTGERHTLGEWMSESVPTPGPKPTAQGVLQTAPNDKKTGYEGLGLYPLGVEATTQATEEYNRRHPDAPVSQAGFQAMTWYEAIRQGASVTHPART